MRYRFRIDLRVLNKGRSAPAEGTRLSEETSEELSPRQGPGNLPSDGNPRTEAYNQTLRWSRRHQPGDYLEASLQVRTTVDPHTGIKRILTRPAKTPNERLAELQVDVDGTLLSRTYVRQEGAPLDLEPLFQAGLDALAEHPDRLSERPGYELRSVLYERQGDVLVRVEAWNAYWDLRQGKAVSYDVQV